MKSFALLSAALALGITLFVSDAEAARRLGGGTSSGMQREALSPHKSIAPAPAPSQATAPVAARPQPAAVPQAQPKRSWMGPLAGLAAGLGLAALASHFGFGEELANLMLMGLAAMAAMMVIGFILRRRGSVAQAAPAGPGAMQYAGAGADFSGGRSAAPEFPTSGSTAAGALASSPAGNIPADFDAAGFLRTAKVNFIRLQAANDAGNLDDIREFTTPEMFGEIKMNHVERGQSSQETDVLSLEAEVLDVTQETGRYVATVRFHGLIREERNGAAEPFDEMWHLVKPLDGSRGWLLAGIQQVG